MARTVTFKGDTTIHLTGSEVAVGGAAPDFTATGTDLSDVKLSDYKGKVVILSSVPSIDTGVCDAQTQRLDKEAADNGVVVLTISCDLPFAQKRWCGATDSNAVVLASDYKDRAFGKTYGLEMADGPLAALLARSVSVIDKDGKVVYHELVPEITQEPDYDKALAAAKSAG
jgi:thiol peroxidase